MGRDGRFSAEVEITPNLFRSSGKHQVCATDGSGVFNVNAVAVDVKAGVVVVGAASGVDFRPGQEVTLSIVGGGAGLNPQDVRVGGRLLSRGEWWTAGDNILRNHSNRHFGQGDYLRYLLQRTNCQRKHHRRRY